MPSKRVPRHIIKPWAFCARFFKSPLKRARVMTIPRLAAKRVKQRTKKQIKLPESTSLTSWLRKSEIQEAVFPSRLPNWFNF